MVLIRFSIQIYIYLFCFSLEFDYFLVDHLSQVCHKHNTYLRTKSYLSYFCFVCVNFVEVVVFIDLVFCMMYFSETEMYISILHYFTYISTFQWTSDLKSSVYPLFYILALFKLLFLAYVDTIYMSSYIFSGETKFEVFKTEKTAFRYLKEEKYRWSGKEKFERLEK